MNILVTGSQGFIAKNLIVRLSELKDYNILNVHKKTSNRDLCKKLIKADLIFHLAGVNKENNPKYNFNNNYLFTKKICLFLESNNKKTKIIYASSIQAQLKNYYGKSKLKAEKILLSYKKKTGAEILIYRLPNIFGKWSKPYYNSVVSTFCHQTYINEKIVISDPKKKLSLLYIDDLISIFLKSIKFNKQKSCFPKVTNVYSITLLNLANLIKSFNKNEKIYLPKNISDSLVKKLYSTYISFFLKKDFTYKLKSFSDHRGYFTEFLKCSNFGQISFFSILPGQIRGNHYHNTKTEKFVVITGKVRFNFVNIITKEKFSILSNEKTNLVVSTIPGWGHNIQNTGMQTAIVLVWANEVFDKNNPDTIFYKVK